MVCFSSWLRLRAALIAGGALIGAGVSPLPLLAAAETQVQAAGNEVKADEGDITIKVVGIKNDKGNLRIGVASTKKNFDEETFDVSTAVKPKDAADGYVFKKLPFGKYAVKVYHDENGNNKLDKNLFGVPSELYGASNDARSSFGPPPFDKAVFTLDKASLTLTIKAE